MFGYVVANIEDANDAEKARYHAAYCGLCRTLGHRCGQRCRLTLSYDMVFLVLLLESLYEPSTAMDRARCATHPLTQHDYACSEVADYAADVTVALAYHKCLDDWADDKNVAARTGAMALRRAYRHVRERLPRQCDAIERELATIGELEKTGRNAAETAGACAAEAGRVAGATDEAVATSRAAGSADFLMADEAAAAFGRLMAELFVREEDLWSDTLRAMGFHLGRFIYLMDAVCDLEHDAKRGSFNLLAGLGRSPRDMEMPLSVIMGNAVAEFEKLPLEQDLHLLRNILYSGVWQKYNAQFKAGGKESAANRTRNTRSTKSAGETAIDVKDAGEPKA